MNSRETENSYFETLTQQRKNITKPETTNSLFPVYALVWNLLCRLSPPADPVWLWPVVLDCVKWPSSYLPFKLFYFISTSTPIMPVPRASRSNVPPGSKIIKIKSSPKTLKKNSNGNEIDGVSALSRGSTCSSMSRWSSVSRQEITKLRANRENLRASQETQDKKVDNILLLLYKLAHNDKDSTKTLTPSQATTYRPLPSRQSTKFSVAK